MGDPAWMVPRISNDLHAGARRAGLPVPLSLRCLAPATLSARRPAILSSAAVLVATPGMIGARVRARVDARVEV